MQDPNQFVGYPLKRTNSSPSSKNSKFSVAKAAAVTSTSVGYPLNNDWFHACSQVTSATSHSLGKSRREDVSIWKPHQQTSAHDKTTSMGVGLCNDQSPLKKAITTGAGSAAKGAVSPPAVGMTNVELLVGRDTARKLPKMAPFPIDYYSWTPFCFQPVRPSVSMEGQRASVPKCPPAVDMYGLGGSAVDVLHYRVEKQPPFPIEPPVALGSSCFNAEVLPNKDRRTNELVPVCPPCALQDDVFMLEETQRWERTEPPIMQETIPSPVYTMAPSALGSLLPLNREESIVQDTALLQPSGIWRREALSGAGGVALPACGDPEVSNAPNLSTRDVGDAENEAEGIAMGGDLAMLKKIIEESLLKDVLYEEEDPVPAVCNEDKVAGFLWSRDKKSDFSFM
uniref:Uncharacterized protein TCIL3000_10_5180 n=1 Tax=Trypanosoma congolense (strain IL3000) TaxID=1068625 RepID=G0UWI7_TRYCI|nr:unnamed protein product [Trypanosoma congolense IL3000]